MFLSVQKGLLALAKGLPRYVRGSFTHSYFDATSYWKERAGAGTGQSRVLWQNEEYNALVRARQREVLRPFIAGLPENAVVLDIGCGIGVVAKMLVGLHATAIVHAVDFPEMVEVARHENPAPRIRYIPSAAEDYLPPGQRYDAIVSSGCYSSIRDIAKLERSLGNAAQLLASGGLLIMIDPFHRWNYLVRARYSSAQVTRYLTGRGLRRVHKSGMLFWPYRDRLANGRLRGAALAEAFTEGERHLARLGPHLWADYKVLVFQKA